jgi:predicted enzyme related to lactoylglutathione lyase
MVWFELVGQHSDSLHDFYAELLDWRLETRHRAAPRRGPWAGRRVFSRRPARGSKAPPWWVTFYTRVPDLDSAIRKARSHGSRVLVPPTRHGDTVIAVVADPEGHPVGLCT